MFQEAFDQSMEVKAETPLEDATLQALTMTFKNMSMYEHIADIYHNAYTLVPQHEEWANHWFMALVRIGDYKKVQQAAMKIYKQFKNDKYHLWIIVALYMQAVDVKSDRKTVLLSLAEKMMDKAANEGIIKDFEGVRLYISILEDLSKYEEALKIIDGNLGLLCKIESDRERMCIALLLKSKNWKLVKTRSMNLLKNNPDDWFGHTSLVESIINSDIDSETSIILEFYKELQDMVKDEKHGRRGPFMGQLLYVSSQDCSQLPKLIINYLNQFGKSLACFEDISSYLSKILQKDIPHFTEELITFLKNIDNVVDKVGQTRTNINIKKIQRYFNTELDIVSTRTEVQSLLVHYYESCHLGTELDERERQYGDEYLIIASLYILDLYYRNRANYRYLFDAVSILELGLEKSKFNYSIKLFLVRLYYQLGIVFR
jgi:tetratricopeptide (TPR) repeat protein